jgi:Tfp pilus assembly protein PilN
MQRINLLPRELRPKIDLTSDHFVGISAVLLLAYVGVCSVYYPMRARIQQNQLIKLESADAEIAAKIAPLTEQLKTDESRERKLAYLQSLLGRKTRWSETFKEFSHILPEGVWFVGLTSDLTEGNRHLVLKGEAVSQRKIAEFFAELENSKLFSGSTINYSEKEPNLMPTVYRFELFVPIPGEGSGGAS